MQQKKILIRWPALGMEATATLAAVENPELCDEIWRCLPFESIMSNAVVTGNSMYCWTPAVSFAPIRRKERISEAPVGRLRYGQGDGNKIIIQYGPCRDRVKGTVLGAVDSDCLEVLRRVGQAAMDATYITKERLAVRFSRWEDEDDAAPAPPPYALLAGSGEAAALCRAIGEASLSAAREEPRELVDLRSGKFPGSFGQYFSTWEFSYSFLRDLSMYTLYPMARFARRDGVDIGTAAALYQDLAPSYVCYLEEWGFVTLHGFSERFTGLMRRGALTKPEFLAILDNLCRYTNMLSSWAYFMFPWGVGAAFRNEE